MKIILTKDNEADNTYRDRTTYTLEVEGVKGWDYFDFGTVTEWKDGTLILRTDYGKFNRIERGTSFQDIKIEGVNLVDKLNNLKREVGAVIFEEGKTVDFSIINNDELTI